MSQDRCAIVATTSVIRRPCDPRDPATLRPPRPCDLDATTLAWTGACARRERSRGGVRGPEVLTPVADGHSNQQAAASVSVSQATITCHLLTTYGKPGVNDRAAAVAEAFRRGLRQVGRP